MGDGWLTPRLGHFTPGKDNRYPLYSRLGGPPGQVWAVAENLANTGIRSPDLPAPSESFYRLNYSGPSPLSVEKVGVVNCFVFHQRLSFSCQSPKQKERTVNPAVVGITLLLPETLQIVRTFLLQSSRTGAFERAYKHGTHRDYSHASNLALPSQG